MNPEQTTDPDQEKVKREAAIERQRIEWVFGFVGGELADEPWRMVFQYHYSDGSVREPSEPDDFYDGVRHYWYEGVPEYAETELTKGSNFGKTLRTAITLGGGYMDAPAAMMYDGQGEWKLVAHYMSSGETECPGRHKDESYGGDKVMSVETFDGEQCDLCEEKVGEDHGYISVGEGYEAVYELVEHVRWEVYVGNIGNVYKGTNEVEARKAYDLYTSFSQNRGSGSRAEGESVQLVKDDEVVKEHVGWNDQEPEPTGEWPEGSGG